MFSASRGATSRRFVGISTGKPRARQQNRELHSNAIEPSPVRAETSRLTGHREAGLIVVRSISIPRRRADSIMFNLRRGSGGLVQRLPGDEQRSLQTSWQSTTISTASGNLNRIAAIKSRATSSFRDVGRAKDSRLSRRARSVPVLKFRHDRSGDLSSWPGKLEVFASRFVRRLKFDVLPTLRIANIANDFCHRIFRPLAAHLPTRPKLPIGRSTVVTQSGSHTQYRCRGQFLWQRRFAAGRFGRSSGCP